MMTIDLVSTSASNPKDLILILQPVKFDAVLLTVLHRRTAAKVTVLRCAMSLRWPGKPLCLIFETSNIKSFLKRLTIFTKLIILGNALKFDDVIKRIVMSTVGAPQVF